MEDKLRRMIYGYARVSTNGQAKDGNSLEDQSSLILSRYSDAQIVPESDRKSVV